MAKDSDPLADAFGTKETDGLFAGLLAEEGAFDRRMMWRLGTWGVVAVGAVVVAVMANQAQLGWRRDQVVSADLAHLADRLQVLTRESQGEARRLASAIETLNADRDRLYARVTVLEQGLDSLTGAFIKQNNPIAMPPGAKAQDALSAASVPPPEIAPVAWTAAAPSERLRKEPPKEPTKEAAKEPPGLPPQSASAASLVPQSPPAASTLPAIPPVASKPDPAAQKPVQPEAADNKPEPAPAPTEVAAVTAKPQEATESEAPAIAVQQTRFAIDLGAANSIDGLRTLWRGLTRSHPELATLRPIIMIREGSNGVGMQLRLGAGPLLNAAAAAKLCAGLSENERHCETTVFDGQRLSMRGGADKGQEKAQEKAQDKGQDKSQDQGAEKGKDQDTENQVEAPPAPVAKPDKHRRSSTKRTKRDEPAPAQPPATPVKSEAAASTGSTLSSFFRR
jgi:hypothetical protein